MLAMVCKSPSSIEAESRPSRPRTNAPASSEKYPSIAVNYDIPMARTKSADGGIVQTLRTIALRHPDTEEGIACEGTAVESSAFKVRKKTFLFARKVDLRLKLLESLPEANQLAAKEPERYSVGIGGWILVKFGEQPPPIDVLKAWIDESYKLMLGPPKKTARKRQ